MTNIREKIEQARLDLIDQGLRNPLINYRTFRNKGLEIVDERAADVFRLLVLSGKSMDFLSDPAKDQVSEIIIVAEYPILPTWVNPKYETILPLILLKYVFQEATPEEESLYEQPGITDEDPRRFTDLHLQTAYSSKELQKRLLETSDNARVHIEEQGVNILYLSLGELIWYEDDNSEISHRAPLVLIPVELLRKSVDSRFTIRYTEGGVGGNIALRERLNSDFYLQLPMPDEGNLDEQELDITVYFTKVEDAIRLKKKWSVQQDAVNIGFFSFGKFRMYHDLDDDVWTAQQKPSTHPILVQLLGEGFSQSLQTELDVASREQIDTYLSLNNNYHIMDADSSQAQAIMAVNKGTTLAIQGPPGTGKSQTIANIIAELVGSGKTVLFVAEKLAALEVVKRRLDAVGIGDLCLELHSHKANKKILLEELRRTFNLGQPQVTNYEESLKTFAETLGTLNAYSDALHESVGQTGASPFQAYGALLRLVEKLNPLDLPAWSDAGVKEWTHSDYQKRLQITEDLQRKMQRDGIPNENPFWGSGIKATLPTTRDLIRRYAKSSLDKLELVISAATELANLLELENPLTLQAAYEIQQIASALLELPVEESIDVTSSEWLQSWAKIEKLLKLGFYLKKESSRFTHIVRPAIWTSNLVSIQQSIQQNGNSFLRTLNPNYRKAIRAFSELCSKPLPSSMEQQLQLLDDLIKIQKQSKILEQQQRFGEQLFGNLWEGSNSNWNRLADIAQAINTLQKLNLEDRLPIAVLEKSIYHLPIDKTRQTLSMLVSAIKEFEAEKDLLFEVAEFKEQIRFGEKGYRQSQLTDLSEMLSLWLKQTDTIQAMALFNISEEELASFGLGELYGRTVGWRNAPLHLVDLFNRNWFEQIISTVVRERKPLQMFDSLTHEERLRKFCEMDQLLLERNRQLIIFRHYQNLSKTLSAAGQVRILREEFEKKRRHKPIRKLIAEAFNAIQSVKPVFMMGPMSVATFLEPGTIQFDVVIFDEASQIRPADAFGSIMRAKQVVVVGDSKQMPPTSFFDSMSDTDDGSEDTRTSDYESILGLFNSRGVKDHMLRWHYRSQHESLIAVSNYEFYENKLLIIPSPTHQNAELGLILHYLPDTYYEPGTQRYNRLEAQAVAQAVLNHARLYPDLTLGVAAFSQAQMQSVRDELEVLRRQNIECEPFFNRHPNEPFFIKNLENVQGDERDVIFISVGYGKTKDGKLSMNFGPLNKDGGERRLNVLITRARYRCEVFTNLLADDLDLTKSQARGVAALKRFLKYAETGDLGLALPSLREPGSPFEEEVAEKLKALGNTVHYQVGTAGFFIDLAIVDPEQPGSYLIGIECDGAQYHRSASARDRDRLRQAILESKGWIIHRIWSTDWFNNPKRELDRTVQAIELSLNKRQRPLRVETAPVEVKIERQEASEALSSKESGLKLQPYQLIDETFRMGWSNIEEIPDSYLEHVIERVVTVEAPIHMDEVIRRVSKGLGFARAGAKIRETLEIRIRRMISVRKVGDFLVMESNPAVTARDRALIPPESRKIEYISPNEVAIVVQSLVESSHGISMDELVREVCMLFGFSRLTQQMQDYMRITVAKILKQPLFIEKNGMFIVSTP